MCSLSNMFLAYLRCSTLKQLKEGSIKLQKDHLLRYSNYHKIKISKYYIDEGVSGAVEKPNLNRLMDDIAQSEIEGVITTDLTRIGRDTVELLTNIQRIKDLKKKFVSVKNNIDTSTKEGRLFLTMLAGFSQYERDMIRERLELGKAYARTHGTKSGKPMHRPKKDVDIEKIRKLRGMGASQKFIAATLGISRATVKQRMISNDIE